MNWDRLAHAMNRPLVEMVIAFAPAAAAVGATLSPVAQYDGTRFNVSPDAMELAIVFQDTVCIRSIGATTGAAKCFDFARSAAALRALLWAPDGHAIAVAGSDAKGDSAIWVLEVTRADQNVPAPVWSAVANSGIGNVELQAWIDVKRLVFRGDYTFHLAEGFPEPKGATCGFPAADGFFERVPGQLRLLGSNRLGDLLGVVVGNDAQGLPTLSCATLSAERAASAQEQWLRFEDALSPSILLFSRQRTNRGANWRLGAQLVAVNSQTLLPVAGAWPNGAPARVSPDGKRLAALRRNQGPVSVALYGGTDWALEFDIPIAWRGDPSTDLEWERMSPQWSKDGRYVLVWFGLPEFGTVLVSALDGKVVASLPGSGDFSGYQWAAGNRLVAQGLSRVAVYDLND